MSKQNLDKLFQEKLTNFEGVPDEQVWESIDASLDKKKKSRRVIPIWWWRLGGVAALFVLFLYVTNPFVSDLKIDDTSTSTVEKESDTLKKEKRNSSPEEVFKTNAAQETGITSTEDPEELENQKNKKEPFSSSITNTQEKDANTAKNLYKSKGAKIIPQNISAQQNQITQTNTLEENNKELKTTKNGLKEGIAQISDPKVNAVDSKNANTDIVENTGQKEKAKQDLLKNTVLKEIDETEGIAQADITEEKEISEDPKKKSIFDEINKEEEEEKDAIAKSSKGKWSVGPSIAPVFFDSFGEGSPIHSNFSSNSKSGNLNLSYGVALTYDISKKLSVRTGVHKVDYGYDTNDVAFSSSLDGSTNRIINNLNYTVTSKNLVVQSKANISQQASVGDLNAQSAALDGRMVQEFGYLEVPLELNYALVDKKFGVNIIGGVSSLFLINNIVTLESEGLSTNVGEANNLNDINFSTNIGFGINYKFTPKVQLNLEPVFKYQLNTFSETAGSFNPFSIGVYSGVSFKF